MLHAGLDLDARDRVACARTRGGARRELACQPDRRRPGEVSSSKIGGPIAEAVQSRDDRVETRCWVHETRSSWPGWEVEIADAQKVKGLAPLACEDRPDRRPGAGACSASATWSRRSGSPTRGPRAERELRPLSPRTWSSTARSAEATGSTRPLIQLRAALPGLAICSESRGRELLASARGPGALARQHRSPSLELIDALEAPDRRDRRAELPRGRGAEHPYVSEAADGAGDRLGARPSRSPPRSARSRALPPRPKLTGYTGLCPRVVQSGESRPPRAAHQAAVRAICAGRCSRRPCTPFATPPTPSATSAQKRRLWHAQRGGQGRPGRHREPKLDRGDLAHALPQRDLRSLRRRFSSGGLTALLDLRRERSIRIDLVLPDEEAIET